MTEPWAALAPLDENAPGAPPQNTGAEPWAGQIPLSEPKQSASLPWYSRFGFGAADPVYGATQLGAHLSGGYTPEQLDPLQRQMLGSYAPPETPQGPEAVKAVDQFVRQREGDYQAQRDAAGQSGTDWARLGGNVLSPANLLSPAFRGASFLGNVGAGAVTGLGAGAMQPVTDENYWGTQAERAPASAALGGVMGPIASLAAGKRAPDVEMLQGEGLALTPGQAGGRVAKMVEGVQAKLPILKSIASSNQEAAIKSYNPALWNQALKPIGQKLPEGIAAGHDANEAGHQAIQGFYENLMPKLSYSPNDAILNGVAEIEQHVPRALRNDFYDKISPIWNDLSGDALKAVDSDLANYGTRYARAQDPHTQDLGDAINSVRTLMRQRLAEINPDSAADLAAANRAFAMSKVVDRATTMSPTAEGIATPAQTLSASSRARGSTERQFSEGRALLQPFAEAANRVIGSSRGAGRAPATAADIIWGDLLGGGAAAVGLGAAGAGESGNGPDWLKYAAGAGLPLMMFTRPGQAAMRGFGPGGAARQGLGGLLQAGPASGIANPQFEGLLNQAPSQIGGLLGSLLR